MSSRFIRLTSVAVCALMAAPLAAQDGGQDLSSDIPTLESIAVAPDAPLSGVRQALGHAVSSTRRRCWRATC